MMNLKEGTRRLALLLGVVGAIGCGFVSYLFLQTTLDQRARHNKFEQLATSDVVKQERKHLQAKPNATKVIPVKPGSGTSIPPPPPGYTIDDDIPPPPPGFGTPEQPNDLIEWSATGKPVTSQPNKGGIKKIHWTENFGVESIEAEDGQTLYPTPAPSAWLYLLFALAPILGFFVSWGTVRAIGWVGAGFAHPSG